MFLKLQAYKEWKIISSFTPSSDSLGESKLVIETPLEKNIATQSRSPVLNPEMYKVIHSLVFLITHCLETASPH